MVGLPSTGFSSFLPVMAYSVGLERPFPTLATGLANLAARSIGANRAKKATRSPSQFSSHKLAYRAAPKLS